ncbi:hypothetical protein KCU88_g117, partial [Aureobasidium melanogenum]
MSGVVAKLNIVNALLVLRRSSTLFILVGLFCCRPNRHDRNTTWQCGGYPELTVLLVLCSPTDISYSSLRQGSGVQILDSNRCGKAQRRKNGERLGNSADHQTSRAGGVQTCRISLEDEDRMLELRTAWIAWSRIFRLFAVESSTLRFPRRGSQHLLAVETCCEGCRNDVLVRICCAYWDSPLSPEGVGVHNYTPFKLMKKSYVRWLLVLVVAEGGRLWYVGGAERDVVASPRARLKLHSLGAADCTCRYYNIVEEAPEAHQSISKDLGEGDLEPAGIHAVLMLYLGLVSLGVKPEGLFLPPEAEAFYCQWPPTQSFLATGRSGAGSDTHHPTLATIYRHILCISSCSVPGVPHGLVGPGKRVTRQKSNGHLNGTPKGPVPSEPVPQVPSTDPSVSAPSHSQSDTATLDSSREIVKELTQSSKGGETEGNEGKEKDNKTESNGAQRSANRLDYHPVTPRLRHGLFADRTACSAVHDLDHCPGSVCILDTDARRRRSGFLSLIARYLPGFGGCSEHHHNGRGRRDMLWIMVQEKMDEPT